MKTKIVLLTIIVTALIIRIISVESLPPSLNWDEVSLGYDSYSILKTGKDQWGASFPLILRVFGDYKLPLYSYLSIPFIAIFGLNTLSTKLVSIISGTILVYLSYLIIYKLTKSKTSSLLAAGLVALSPWSIFISRIALEANLYLALFASTFYFLISKKPGLASIFLALSLFSYNSSRVIFPVFLILIAFYQFHNIKTFSIKKYIPLVIALILVAFQIFSQSGQARYKWVSIIDEGAINQINELRSKYPRFVINKATYFTYQVIKNYLSHFNPTFIFQNGGSHYQFNIPRFYLLHPLLLPFYFLGLLYVLKNHKKSNYLILLILLLVSPIPSSITRDAPHTLRSISFIYLSTLIIALSPQILSKVKSLKSNSIILIVVIITISQLQFWPKYVEYSNQYSQSWQYGHQSMVTYLKNNYQKYDQIIITKKYGEPHEFILFYWPWDPKSYQNDPQKNADYYSNWYWVDSFDKFKFVNDWEIKDKTLTPSPNTLLITSPDNYNIDVFNKLETIYFKDQSEAFEILKHE
jgi:4-amino-4-deoxy-L-arabinose transferase-like glycosyltransferase